MKFKIAHCFKKGSLIKYKGAILLIENDSYIIKFGFKTLDMLNINATAVTAIPNYLMCFRGINLTDGAKSYNLYFNDSVADEIYSYFALQRGLS